MAAKQYEPTLASFQINTLQSFLQQQAQQGFEN